MTNLIDESIAAHGGLRRWSEIRSVSALALFDGAALHLRGQSAFVRTPTRVTIDPKREGASFDPFLRSGQVGIFEPLRTMVVSANGSVLEELKHPRESYLPDAPWSGPQLAYFAGYALWTYLTLPFSLLNAGVECTEAGTWHEDGEIWKVLNVTFPPDYVTHCSEQVLYVDERGLIRRHDYAVDVAGGSPAAHYLYDHQVFDGILFPTRRRIYPRGADQKPNKDLLIMAADFSDFRVA